MDDMQMTASDGGDGPDSLGAPSSQVPDSLASGRVACEACRTRKVRCDKDSPCLPCRRADIKCVYPAAKRKEKRTRILLTPQYERKIDTIEHRLDDITKLLHDLKTYGPVTSNANNAEGSGTRAPGTALPSVSPASTQSLPPNSAREAVVEGESSLPAHTVFVDNFLQTFFEAMQPDPEIQTTIDSLSQIVSASNQEPEARESVLPNARLPRPTHQRKFNLPPIQNATALIRAAQAERLAGTGWVYEYLTMQSFGDLCLKVYFGEDVSPYDIISVNAGLYSLFWDYASTAKMSEDDKEHNMAYARLCRNNLETGLAEIPLHVPASADVIAALLFGAFYSIEFSTPSLSWSLSSKASEMCQTLGYHRELPRNSRQSVSPRYAHFLFWMTYYVDKSLSLRLGRASTIQDWDITASPPSISSEDKAPVLAFFVFWIKTARCQGNIYEMLYSPSSAAQPDDVRQARVTFLAASLHEVAQETERIKTQWLKLAKENSGDHLMDFYSISDEVLRLSLLTHVYRAAPKDPNSSATFKLDCIEAARATLDRHHDCMAVIHQDNDAYFAIYINWTLLFAPFVPFIVLFCHVMETRDRTDSARLDAFVTSIHSATTVSEPAAKMHRLFQMLNKIAARYIEVGMQDSSTSAMDEQLAALGFPRAGLWEAQSDMELGSSELAPDLSSLDPVLWMGDNLQLEDWFYTNQVSMELLQGDDMNFT